MVRPRQLLDGVNSGGGLRGYDESSEGPGKEVSGTDSFSYSLHPLFLLFLVITLS